MLPSGLTAADLDLAALVAGRTVTGTKGSIVFAAAPYQADVQLARTAEPAATVLNLTQA